MCFYRVLPVRIPCGYNTAIKFPSLSIFQNKILLAPPEQTALPMPALECPPVPTIPGDTIRLWQSHVTTLGPTTVIYVVGGLIGTTTYLSEGEEKLRRGRENFS